MQHFNTRKLIYENLIVCIFTDMALKETKHYDITPVRNNTNSVEQLMSNYLMTIHVFKKVIHLMK